MPVSPLPTSSTSFVGRAEELANIDARLADPHCRLLTLIGPGGIGKSSRLVLHAAAGQRLHFAHGVYFVPLTALGSSDLLAAALAGALQLTSLSDEDLPRQIVRSVRDKQILLVLDNFEHLLRGTDLLSEILQQAAGVKFLVTSRERLNLQEEWTLIVDGLSFPDVGTDDHLENYSAVQLFVQRARQVQDDFSLSGNAESVAIICQAVREGMPLAVELAASWLRALSCRQIVAQMTDSLNFLTTPLRNVPERHRSLRTVFEQSWRLLSETERDVLMKLSIFRGGFEQEAAEQVAGATLALLASLLDKSLMRLLPSERYDLHELVRAFAADKLDEAGAPDATASRHLDYYLNLAEQAEAHVYGREQSAWLDRLEVELDNLRGALAWSIEGSRAEMGLQMTAALRWFWEYRGHFSEGLAWFERIHEVAADVSPSVRSKALHRAGELAGYLRNAQAENLCLEALALARQTNDPRNIAWALSALAFTTYADVQGSVPLLNESLTLFRELDDPLGMSHALRRYACAAMGPGDYPYARGLLEEALTRAQDVGDTNAAAWVLFILGQAIWRQHDDPQPARALLEESVSLFRQLSHDGLAACYPLIYLAGIEYVLGNEARAQRWYEEGLALLGEIGAYNPENLPPAWTGVRTAAEVQPDREQTATLKFEQQLAWILDYLGCGEDGFAIAWSEAKSLTVQPVVAEALKIDLLSQREVEVLQLIAQGCTNREIADSLYVGASTVKKHINHIYDKLDAKNRVQAVARARQRGILP